jgi:hypothetical protein
MFGEQPQAREGGPESVRDPVPTTGPAVGLVPPGVEYWGALFKAQSTVKPVAHDADVSKKGQQDKKGDKLFTYASAAAIQEEALRVLHGNNLLVVQLATMASSDRSGRRQVLHCSFMVVHAPTGQGMVYPFEAPIGVTEKFALRQATSAACTTATGYFLKGLLQIRTPEEAVPEQQGPQWPPAQQQAMWQQPQPQQSQQQPAYDPQAEHAAAWAAYNAQQAAQQAQAQNAQAVQAQSVQQAQAGQVSTQAQQYPGWEWDAQARQWVPDSQLLQSLSEHPTVKAAAAILEATLITGQQAAPAPVHKQDAPREITEEFVEDEPNGPDAWATALTAVGVERQIAEEFASYPLTHALNDGMRGLLWKQIEKCFGSPDNPENAAKARLNWEGTGFVPRPDLPEEQRPRPNGVNALRYLLNAHTRRTTT